MRHLPEETARRVLAALLVAAALPLAGSRDAPVRRVVMSSLAPDYVETVPAAKAELLAVINEERKAHGAGPLAYDLLGAKVGDEFCEDAALNRTSGHWDLAGRAPYLRWALAGGIDHHAQNFAAESRTGYAFSESPAVLLKKMHALFMAEKPPDDGHRRTVLDPIWTHVGIGFAIVGGEMRMTEEYSRRVLEWAELPSGPVKAGKGARVAFGLPRGWSIGGVEVAWEEFPKPMSRREIAARDSYGLPPAWRMLRPHPPPGARWASGEPGNFKASAGGRVEIVVPLDRGPGHYYLVVYAAEGTATGRKLFPVAAPLVVAE
ncbi:MAG: CAP domain-containing protein [Thermoanaerobaculia bacterium]|nr:CAP domain-containing protein [Thermoanaerobaculia bacterium]